MKCTLYSGATDCTENCNECSFMCEDGWRLIPFGFSMYCNQNCRRRKQVPEYQVTEHGDCDNCKFNKGV